MMLMTRMRMMTMMQVLMLLEAKRTGEVQRSEETLAAPAAAALVAGESFQRTLARSVRTQGTCTRGVMQQVPANC